MATGNPTEGGAGGQGGEGVQGGEAHPDDCGGDVAKAREKG